VIVVAIAVAVSGIAAAAMQISALAV